MNKNELLLLYCLCLYRFCKWLTMKHLHMAARPGRRNLLMFNDLRKA